MSQPDTIELLIKEQEILYDKSNRTKLNIVHASAETRQRIIDVFRDRFKENESVIVIRNEDVELSDPKQVSKMQELRYLLLNFNRKSDDLTKFQKSTFYEIYKAMSEGRKLLKYVLFDLFGENRDALKKGLQALNTGRGGYFPDKSGVNMIFIMPNKSKDVEEVNFAYAHAGDFLDWWDGFYEIEA